VGMNVDAIIRMAKRGRPVFPLQVGGKKPLVKWGTDASTVEKQIRAWWTMHPDANVGMVTGKKSGFFVLDIDVKKGVNGFESIAALESELGPLPRTLSIQTASGGRHLYFEWQDELAPATISAGLLGKGIDWRGNGGFVVVPPSRTSEGTWHVLDNVPPVLLPEAWVECIVAARKAKTQAADKPATTTPRNPLAPIGYGFDEYGNEEPPPPDAPETTRNVTLASAAGRLRRNGATIEEIDVALQRINAGYTDPIPRSEVSVIARSVGKYEVGPAPLNDSGNARRFGDRYRDCISWVSDREVWVEWNGAVWGPVKGPSVTALAIDLVSTFAIEAAEITDEEHRKVAAKWAIQSGEQRRLNAMVNLAKSQKPIAVPSSEFDADLAKITGTKFTVVLKPDGRVEQLNHSPEDYITKTARASGDLSATCDLWASFLERIQPDPEVRDYLQRCAAYSLVGGQAGKCAFVVFGPGDSGKSAFLETLADALGEYTYNGDVSMFSTPEDGGNTPRLAAARGARLVVCPEIPRVRTFEADVFKKWTGGDMISAMAKNKDPISFRPEGKVWFAGNHAPKIDAEDNATWSRIRVIPFRVVIPKAEQDDKLRDKLNLNGVFAWAVAGWPAYCERGLAAPAITVEATEQARDDGDRMAESLLALVIKSPGESFAAGAFRRAYVQRCRENAEPILGASSMRDIMAGRHGLVYRRSAAGGTYTGGRLSALGRAYGGDVDIDAEDHGAVL